MADHHDHIEMDGPFPAGWFVAVGAGLIVALVARWFAAPLTGAVVLGLGTFVIYAVLLGQFWEEPAGEDHGHGHDHGGHAH